MRLPVSLVSLFRGAVAASVGCLLMASPIAFAQARATAEASDTKIAPAARPGAAATREPAMAPSTPTRPTMKKTQDPMRRIGEPTVAPDKADRGLQRVAPAGVERVAPAGLETPKRGMAPAGGLTPEAVSPADDLRMKQAARKFEAQSKRMVGEMASEKKRFAEQQQSELARENEKTLAKMREFSQSEGRIEKIRGQAAKLMEQAEGASPSEAQAIEEQAAKLLRELEGR